MSFNLKRFAKFAALGAVPVVAVAGLVTGASVLPADDPAPVAMLAPPSPAPPAPPAPPEQRARERAEKDARSKRAWLGVMLDEDDDGVRILEVMEETPAEEAGLRKGDRIVKIGGKEVEEYEDLVDAMRTFEPGQKVDVVVDRNGSEKSFDVTLGEKAIRHRIEMVHPGHGPHGDYDTLIWGGPRLLLGVEVHPMSRELRRAMGAGEDAGVLVNRVHEDTAAAAAGIQVGDVITSVDGRPVRRPGDIRQALMENEPGDKVPVTVIRDGGEKTLDVTLEDHDAERSRGPMVIPFDGDHGVRAFAYSMGDGDDDFDFDFDFDWDADGFNWSDYPHEWTPEQQEEFQQKMQDLNQRLQETMKKFQEKMQVQQERLKNSQEEIRKKLRELGERDRDRAIRARQVNQVYDI